VIATPPASHAELALSALRAGHDVLVEKPMALSLADALLLEDAAAAAGRVLMVGHILEYHPAVVELRRRISAGDLGDVRLVISERTGPSVRRHEDAWWSLGPHDLSVMRLLSSREPKAVSVRGWSSDHPTRADVVVARVDADGGVLGIAHLSTVAPKKVRRITVIGSEGVALFDDLARGRELCFFDRRTLGSTRTDDVVGMAQELLPADRDPTDVLDGIASDRWLPAAGGRALALAAGEPLMIEAQHFISGVLGQGAIQSDAASGRQVVAALEAGAASLNDGGATRPVALGREPR